MIDLTLARNVAQQALLTSFLESSRCPQNTMNFYQLDGYLRAISCAPDATHKIEWHALIFNEATPDFENSAQESAIHEAIAELYHFHCEQVKNSCCDLPCMNAYASLQKDRIDVEQWARGFLQGYIVCESNWNQLFGRLNSEQNAQNEGAKTILDEFDDILSTVSTVADAEYAVHEGTDPDELSAIFAQLPDSVIQCGRIGRLLDQRLAAIRASNVQEVSFVKAPAADKVSRNDSCPCGSGKKFKKCCLH